MSWDGIATCTCTPRNAANWSAVISCSSGRTRRPPVDADGLIGSGMRLLAVTWSKPPAEHPVSRMTRPDVLLSLVRAPALPPPGLAARLSRRNARSSEGPDPVLATLAAEPRACERGGQTFWPDPVHGAVASRRRWGARTGVPAAETCGQSRRRSGDGGGLRAESGGQSPASARKDPQRTVLAQTGASRPHPES